MLAPRLPESGKLLVPSNPQELMDAFEKCQEDPEDTHPDTQIGADNWKSIPLDTVSDKEPNRLFFVITAQGAKLCGVVTTKGQPTKIISFNTELDEDSGVMEVPNNQTIQLGRYLNDEDGGPAFFPPKTSYEHCAIRITDTGQGNAILSIIDGTASNTEGSSNGTGIVAAKNLEILKQFGPELPNERSASISGGKEGEIATKNKRLQAATHESGGHGKYPTNEDAVGIVPTQGAAIAADGVGSSGKGAAAAHNIMRGVIDGIERRKPWQEVCDGAVTQLNQHKSLRGDPQAGATLAYTRKLQSDSDGNQIIEALNVGDAKNYILQFDELRGWEFIYVSRDQSRVQDMLEGPIKEPGTGKQLRQITPLESYTLPERRYTSNSISAEGYKTPEIKYVRCRPGAICISVTDGVSDVVSPEDILDLVKQHGYNITPEIIAAFADKRQEFSCDKGYFPIKLNGKYEKVQTKRYDNVGVAIQIS